MGFLQTKQFDQVIKVHFRFSLVTPERAAVHKLGCGEAVTSLGVWVGHEGLRHEGLLSGMGLCKETFAFRVCATSCLQAHSPWTEVNL